MLTVLQKDVLIRIIELLRPLDIIWALTGSASFSLQGMDVKVNDIDIQTDENGAYAIGRALEQYIVKPVSFSSTDIIRSHFGQFKMDGVPIEIMGDIQKFWSNKWEDIVYLPPIIRSISLDQAAVPVLDLRYESTAYRKLGRINKAEAIELFLSSKP